MSEKQKRKEQINYFVLIFTAVIDFFLITGYLREIKQKAPDSKFYFFVISVIVISMVINCVTFFRNKGSKLFRRITMIGFTCVYIAAMSATKSDLTFSFAFPMIALYILYFDEKFYLRSAIGLNITNIGFIAYFFIRGTFPSGIPASFALAFTQFSTIGVSTIVVYNVIRANNRLIDRQMALINEEQEHNTALLTDIMSIASVVKKNSDDAGNIITEWDETSNTVTKVLEDISNGNTENSISIENQTQMTGKIHEMIISAKEESATMVSISGDSVKAIQSGKTLVNDLKEKAEQVEKSNQSVSNSMSLLIENANEVEKITNAIFSISSQTNLLALNASIESARAGELGKGFAVVAEEIRVLADQTRELTQNISNIVTSLQTNANHTKDVVEEVIIATNSEKELIDVTKHNFDDIEVRINQLSKSVDVIDQKVNNIVNFNDEIVSTTADINRVSNELNHNTKEAVMIGNENTEKARQAKLLMSELLQKAEELNKYNEK